MTDLNLDSIWALIWGAIALRPEVFHQIQLYPHGERVALIIVLAAGLSQALGQSIILFVNRVKPFRFVLSLLLASLLFAISYLFWVGSTWVVYQTIFRQGISPFGLARTLGLAYAPQLLEFLVALPYFGVPISILLSIWSFLAFLVGMTSTLNLTVGQAATCGLLGWVMLQVLQRTIGRPIAALGRWLSNTTAGVSLITNLRDLEKMVEERVSDRSPL